MLPWLRHSGWIQLTSVAAEHKSRTCVILRGIAKHNFQEISEGDEVVVKLMKEEHQFRREIDARREGLGGNCVVQVIASSEDAELHQRWQSDATRRGYGEYPRGIVMQAAQRNLMVILVRRGISHRGNLVDFTVCVRSVADLFSFTLVCAVFSPQLQEHLGYVQISEMIAGVVHCLDLVHKSGKVRDDEEQFR